MTTACTNLSQLANAAFSVTDYRTGDRLPGFPSEALVAASAAAGPSGVVGACFDAQADVWQHVPAGAESLMVECGHRVVSVYVD